MGASESTPAKASTEEEDLFTADELETLHAAFAAFCKFSDGGGSIHVDALLRAGALPPALPWAALLELMRALDDPGAGGAAATVGWPGFVRGVARCCKGPKGARRRALVGLYASSAGRLGADGARALLRDSLAAARAGGADAAGAASAAFAAPLADALAGADGAPPAVAADDFAAWAGAQLPALSSCLDAHLLALLRAIGGAADAKAAAAAAAPAAAMSAVHEPLLEGAAGQAEERALLRGEGAWLLALALGDAAPGEARAWRCLYASAAHGLSLNRFVHHTAGYSGPTLLVVATDRGELLGAHIDAPLKPSDAYFGGAGCFLFSLAPNFHVYRPTGLAKNFAFFNPPLTGTMRGAHYGAASAAPQALAFGGQTSRFRLALEDDLNTCRYHTSCTTYRAHGGGGGAAAAGADAEGARRVVGVELWGCGGVEAAEAQRRVRERHARDLGRARHFDTKLMFGAGPGWKDEAQRDADVDKFILETAGAHTFYGDRLQDVEEEQRTMARAPR